MGIEFKRPQIPDTRHSLAICPPQAEPGNERTKTYPQVAWLD